MQPLRNRCELCILNLISLASAVCCIMRCISSNAACTSVLARLPYRLIVVFKLPVVVASQCRSDAKDINPYCRLGTLYLLLFHNASHNCCDDYRAVFHDAHHRILSFYSLQRNIAGLCPNNNTPVVRRVMPCYLLPMSCRHAVLPIAYVVPICCLLSVSCRSISMFVAIFPCVLLHYCLHRQS